MVGFNKKSLQMSLAIADAILVRKEPQIVPRQIAKTNTNTRKMSFFASLSITISKIPLKTMPIILA